MAVSTASPVVPVLQGMDLTSINTIRTLSMDAVQAANSASGSGSFVLIRRTLSGQTATASFFQLGTPRCCSTLYFT